MQCRIGKPSKVIVDFGHQRTSPPRPSVSRAWEAFWQYFILFMHFDRWRGKGIASAETEDAQSGYRISKPGRVSP